jgi:hypothetical protein
MRPASAAFWTSGLLATASWPGLFSPAAMIVSVMQPYFFSYIS